MNKIESLSAHKWIEKDKRVWIKANKNYYNPNEDAFLQGKVNDIINDQAIIELVDSQKDYKIPINQIQKLTYGPNDVADMVDLQQLNQPQLLYNIKRRYLNDLIFTYCGPTLVIINPYSFIQKLFNQNVLQQYQSQVFTDNLQYKNLYPHIFGLSAFCLWQLFQNQRNQSIVISGESGAGKTQNTKYCLKFLASLGKNMKDFSLSRKKGNNQLLRNAQKAIKKASNKLSGIQDRILGCNQILQAFGNAKTIRNDNSSRFGKLILLLYGQTQIDIRSALITSYLLQKSRIVSISDGERNYHVFYYFCKGTSPQEKKKYLLNDPIQKYHYLNQSNVYQIKGKTDQSQFQLLKQQFYQYLNEDQVESVLKFVSIVLNIGNLLFQKTQTKDNEQSAIITNQQYLKNAAYLLEVDFQVIKHSFTFRTRKSKVTVTQSPLKYDEVIAFRDSFAKNVYEKVFSFLVQKLNEKIQIQKIEFDNQYKNAKNFRKSIGILDIFGFQVLGVNTLEQFFINFANEKLQQLYVSYIFKQEQNQFLKQGLKQFSHDIGFQDNKGVIDLFELYPLGIFHLINQSSQLNKPDDQLPSSINRNHPKNPIIVIPMSKKGLFQINHSCSPVMYNTNSFTAKNKDQFPNQFVQVVKTLKNQTMKYIILGKPQQGNVSSSSKKFLGSKFMNDMSKLTQQLYNCDCHFVRCIKPNSQKAAKMFNSAAVLQSLRYLGVLDSIIIRKLGYIYRRPYKQFYKKVYQLKYYTYDFHMKIKNMTEDNFKQQSKIILQKYCKNEIEENNILFGVKKIMIKESALNNLELMLKEKRKLRVTTVNRVKRMYLNAIFRSKVNSWLVKIRSIKAYSLGISHLIREKILLKKTIMLQKAIKKFLWQRRLQKIKQQATKSVTRIGANFRMMKVLKEFKKIRQKVVKLQCCCRAFISAGRFFRQKSCKGIILEYFGLTWKIIQKKKAIEIQRVWKGFRTRKIFRKEIQAIKKNLILKKIKQKFQKALFTHRYRLFKSRLEKYRKPIIMLQTIVKRRYCQRAYKRLKQSAIIIQKAYRKHLTKKFYLNRLWNKYKTNLITNSISMQKQLSKLGFRRVKSKVYHVQETIRIPFKMYPNQILNSYLKKQQQFEANYLVNQTLSFIDKNTFQCYIGDFDMISDTFYKGTWLQRYIQTRQEMNRNSQYPLNINIQDNYTAITSSKDKIYIFPQKTNKNTNLRENKKVNLMGIPKLVQVNQSSGYFINNENKLYTWSIQEFEGKIHNSELREVTSKYVSYFTSRGQNKFFATKQGKVYKMEEQQNQSLIKLYTPLNKINITQIAASYRFVHFLTDIGLIYSLGANYYGQLGLGCSNKMPIDDPQLNNYLKNKKEIIQSISVGIGHTIAKSKLGYVYGWGDNNYGQINNKKIQFYDSPTIIDIDKLKSKAFQAVAGSRASYFLTDSLKVFLNGTSSCLPFAQRVQGYQTQLLNDTSLIYKNLIPIKISTSWTNTLSILMINAFDFNKCKEGIKIDIAMKYAKTIAKQWKTPQIYPQYHEWMDSALKLIQMRKFKFTDSPTKNLKKGNQYDPQNQLQQLKLLMELRKTSEFFKISASKKVKIILQKLKNKPQDQWNHQEIQLNNYIRDHCMNIIK